MYKSVRLYLSYARAGIDPTTIHRRLKVGRSSIYRMKRSLQQHGTAYAPPETNKKNGRPRVMTPEQELVSTIASDSPPLHWADLRIGDTKLAQGPKE